MEKRITCLLGAGAAIEVGGPTSINLTKSIIEESEFLRSISVELDKYYGENNYSFEDLLHFIETASSYMTSSSALKKYKPILGAFITISSMLNAEELIHARSIIYTKVWDAIQLYDNELFISEKNAWYSDFWGNLNRQNNLDIITLNYDTTIQQSLGSFTDGFLQEREVDNFSRLSLEELNRKDISKVINLHGSIMFGGFNIRNPEEANRYSFEDDFHELYKYSNYETAREMFFSTGKSSRVTQSGEIAEITPIITGLRKADKLIIPPYNAFHHYFFDSIRNNSGLLIVGYSFGDLHVNSIIDKITALHGDNRRIVVITYITPKQRDRWHPDNEFLMDDDGWLTTEALSFYSKAAKDYKPLGDTFYYNNPITSKDGRVKIYLEGFKQAVENHSNEIIEFLTMS
ncbi:SIR2 family protein [Viridibacillus arvi]|uniref:SIR2 family protein n=1 Tax=Viridibacillus arvi TaxID=263475 RepID=UPI003D2A9EF2